MKKEYIYIYCVYIYTVYIYICVCDRISIYKLEYKEETYRWMNTYMYRYGSGFWIYALRTWIDLDF